MFHISGKIVDEKNKPIPGANIFINGTYDGASSDENGNFSFETSAQNNQVLIVSFLIYETLKMDITFLDKTESLTEEQVNLTLEIIEFASKDDSLELPEDTEMSVVFVDNKGTVF